MTLAQLKIGEDAIVRRIDGQDDAVVRLMEMGLTPGVTVHVNGTAPLGDPLHLTVRGYNLSIRKDEAARIEVERLS
ncbi:MAG: hypothetical protein D6815_02730 [Candidatus Dadabacteria bacterium]|nr:MAG: hypothetical protein D6815_02730 [Candidatus Dadabacteria bacterium]